LFELTSLKDTSRLVRYPQGTVFNDDAVMYFIFQGEAGIVAGRSGEHHLAARLGPGDFFYETALFLQKESAETIISLTDLVALPLHRNEAVAFFSKEPAFVFQICQELCERIHSMNSPEADELPAHMYGAKDAAPATDTAVQNTVSSTHHISSHAPTQAGAFALFPEGYGTYTLPLNNGDRDHLLEKNAVCPLCGQNFKHMSVRPSRLVLASTDSDMRPHYNGVEPLYYDVTTCPHCLYSALSDMFDNPGKPGPEFCRELTAVKDGSVLRFGPDANADSVFAGYYLALFCAPHCFVKPQMTEAKLLYKLSRVYQDAGDSHMETVTAQQALDTYMYVYQNIEIPPSQDQQLCLVIAELALKLGQLREAKDFFFKVKINRSGAPLLKRQAENRLFELRENGK